MALPDAGLTPYRGVKKLRDAGALGPGRVVGVMGVGALGTYAVQYAKLLGGVATVVAFARNAGKLEVARKLGADHAIDIGGRSLDDIRAELRESSEVVALAEQGKVRHTVHPIRFEDVNDAIDHIRTGEIVGRAVITY